MSAEAPKIIVVDDDDAFRRVVARLLKANGFQALEPTTMTEIIGVIRKENPELMLLDLCMPRTSGMEVVKTIRSMGMNLPVVIISGRIRPEDLEILRSHGVSEFLVKPFTMNTLLTRIEKVFGKPVVERSRRPADKG
ncbi:MAG: response regulator [Candidatus Glassbacteria bacterium]|nr:response regulator [Candidatus Glassbacteria bacterium]